MPLSYDEMEARMIDGERRVAELEVKLRAAQEHDNETSIECGHALVREAGLERDREPRPMSTDKPEAWVLAHVPDECVLSLRWMPVTYGDFGEGWVDQNNKSVEPVDWIPMPARPTPDAGEKGD